MKNYRITKFNPERRNTEGHYLDDDWTAISDIKNPKYNTAYEDYEKVESAYVQAVKLIMTDNKLDNLTIKSFLWYSKKKDIEKFIHDGRLQNLQVDFDKEIKILKDDVQLNLTQIDKIIRLILREVVDLTLINNQFQVQFGYDYYMYVRCNHIQQSTIDEIHGSGLFVENFENPYDYYMNN